MERLGGQEKKKHIVDGHNSLSFCACFESILNRSISMLSNLRLGTLMSDS